MKRAVLVCALSLLAGCARDDAGRAPDADSSSGAPGSPTIFAALSFDDALARARTEKKLLMVDVYTDWCGWCRKLDRDVFTDARVRAALKDVLPIRVNAEKGGRNVASRYGVRGLPTLLFVNAEGDVVTRFEGYVSADGFLKILEKLPGTRV